MLYIRLMLDGASPAAFDGLFVKAIEAAGQLTPFQCLDGRVPIALDGSEHFCSRKIKCEQCSTRRRADGGTEYFHAFLGASMVAPGHKQVLPLPPEFIAPQDGAEKQDCERNAAKRWLARHGADLAHLRPVYLGDDLFACQPIVAAIQDAGGNFILTCKPASHKTIAEYLPRRQFSLSPATRWQPVAVTASGDSEAATGRRTGMTLTISGRKICNIILPYSMKSICLGGVVSAAQRLKRPAAVPSRRSHEIGPGKAKTRRRARSLKP